MFCITNSQNATHKTSDARSPYIISSTVEWFEINIKPFSYISRTFNAVCLIYLRLNSTPLCDYDATIAVNHELSVSVYVCRANALHTFKCNLNIKLTGNIVQTLIYLMRKQIADQQDERLVFNRIRF